MTRSTLSAWALPLAALLVLSGCAAGGPVAGPAEPSSPTPTAACPRLEDVPDSERDCAVYDPDAAMAENERYREQQPVEPSVQADLDALVEPARTALEALPVPASTDDVTAALGTVGVDPASVQISDHGTGIVFGAAVGGGCLTGSVSPDGTVDVAGGGFIADGGCLAAQGH